MKAHQKKSEQLYPSNVSGKAEQKPPEPKQHNITFSVKQLVCILIAVVIATAALCFTVPELIKKAKSKAQVTVQAREQELRLITSDEFGGGQGWETDFVFTNTSDVLFTPESIVAYFYEGDRLDNKIKLNYDEICR